jgi:hypothetical protein
MVFAPSDCQDYNCSSVPICIVESRVRARLWIFFSRLFFYFFASLQAGRPDWANFRPLGGFFLLWAFLFKTFYFVSSRFNSWVLLLLTHLEICHVLFMNWTIGKL